MPRIRYGSLARIVVILSLFCLWLQLMLSASSGGMYREDDSHIAESIELRDLLLREKYVQDTSNQRLPSETSTNSVKPDINPKFTIITTHSTITEELMNANDTSEQVLALVPPELHKYLTVHSRNSTINATEKAASKNISDIRRAIDKYNDAQNILNEDIFGPVQNNTIIIAIQVHTRLTYLRHLIVSLAQARDIDKTLLVFSHDYYDEEVNALVRSIDFTKVLQIFYPYSIQVHPHEFPGIDPNDCPRDAKFEQAVKLKCNNANHPDLHGHYREAKYTQTKHHWWWKANRIFNQLRATSSHSGMVLFLEEDHYVAEDFLHMLSILRAAADRSCAHCEILSLGTYLKTYQYHVNGDKRRKQLALSYAQQRTLHEESRKRQNYQTWNYQVFPNLYASTQKVEITPWHSSMHNMGFAFNRTVWNNIMELEEQFCAYDDYNWDYSLLHLSQNRPGREKFKVIMCKGPRVFHIGECGFHHKKSNCNASTVISKVQKLLQTAKSSLYPSRVTATVTAGGAKHNKKLIKGNGGWGDIRDQELCTNMTKLGREPRKFPYYL